MTSPLSGPAIDLAGASVGGDVLVQFGLTAAPTGFRRLVSNFVRLYLGTERSPVPFGGRDAEINALNAWLDGRVASAAGALEGDLESNNLLITAPAGRGKTAVIVRWIQQLQGNWSVAFVPVSIRAETNQALTFYQALGARLADLLGEPLPEPRSDPAAYYRDKVIDYLDRVGKGDRNCVVVIDGLDEARGWKMDTTVLPVDPSPRLKIVISARELAGDSGASDWLDRLGWVLPLASAATMRVKPLTRDGIADVLRRMQVPIAPLSQDVDIIDELFRLTENGDPLVLHFYANDLLRKGDAAARLKPADLRTLEPGFGAYIKRWLDEQRTEWGVAGIRVDQDLVDAMLAVLASAFGPIKLADLEELVSRILARAVRFTVRTVDPLSRFVLGDGVDNGYVLSHPKLSEFLQRDYFAGSRILRDAQESFLGWMHEVVKSVNGGERLPADVPPYALLYYTQHLSVLPPAREVLEQYRDLVEDGWRRAWQQQEGGLQGFSRDVELAARAFRAAANARPEQLQAVRTGLGAQIRCMLCLSSIRSIGLGAAGELLAELIRSRAITPRQALYLAQLKEDRQRATTIRAIIELLPPDLRVEAYAGATDILNPQTRFDVLVAIAPHLSVGDQRRALGLALEIAKALRTHEARLNALNQLTPLLGEAIIAPAIRDEEREAPAEAASKSGGHAADTAESSEAISAELSYDSIGAALAAEAQTPDLSPDRMQAILELLRTRDGYWIREAFRSLASRMSREHQALALDIVRSHPRDTFRGNMLVALIPHLPSDLLDQIIPQIGAAPMHDTHEVIEALANHLDEAGRRRAADAILGMSDGYYRVRALSAILPFLDSERVQTVLGKTQQMPDDYYRSRQIKEIAPYLTATQAADVIHWTLGQDFSPSTELEALAERLSVDEGLALARELGGERRAKVLAAILPRLDERGLAGVAELVREIQDAEHRGELLAKVLRRLREAGLSTTVADAYSAAFAIGDAAYLHFAEAALLSYLGGSDGEARATRIAAYLAKEQRGPEDNALLVRSVAIGLTSGLLAEAEARQLLDHAVAQTRDIVEKDARAMAIIALNGRLPVGEATRLINEMFDVAKVGVDNTTGPVLALLAACRPPEEVDAALQDLGREIARSAMEDAMRTELEGVIRIVAALANGPAGPQLREDVRRALTDMGQAESAALTSAALVLMLGPKLSAEHVAPLIEEVLAGAEQLDEPEGRGMLLAVLAAYLPTPRIWQCIQKMLDIGARSSRPAALMGLGFAQGLVQELLRRSPRAGGNRLPGSPLGRLGGEAALRESVEAIEDVSAWWP